MIIYNLLAVLIMIPAFHSKRYHSIMGPYDVHIQRIERCPPGTEVKDHVEWKTRQMQRRLSPAENPVLDAECMAPFDINNTMSAHTTLASWSNMGGWKENAHVFHFKEVCSEAAKYHGIKKFLTSLFFSSIGETLFLCPFSAGIYRVTSNFTVKMPELPIKHFFYGRWRLTGKLILPSGGTGMCGRVLMETVPK